jgi:hypothetical protein
MGDRDVLWENDKKIYRTEIDWREILWLKNFRIGSKSDLYFDSFEPSGPVTADVSWSLQFMNDFEQKYVIHNIVF